VLNRELGSTARNYQTLARQFDRLFRRYLYRAGRDAITKQDYLVFEKLATSMSDRPSTDTISNEMGPPYSKFMMRWLKEIKAKEYEVNNQMRKIEDRLHRQEDKQEVDQPPTHPKDPPSEDSRPDAPQEVSQQDSDEEPQDLQEEKSRRVERIDIGATNPQLDDSYIEDPPEDELEPPAQADNRLKRELLEGLSESERNRQSDNEAGQEEMDLDAEGDEYEQQNLTNPDDIQQLVDEMPSRNDSQIDSSLEAPQKTAVKSKQISQQPSKQPSLAEVSADASKDLGNPPSKKESTKSRPKKDADSSIKLKPLDESFEQQPPQTFAKKDKPSLDAQRETLKSTTSPKPTSTSAAREQPSRRSSASGAIQPATPAGSNPRPTAPPEAGLVAPSKRPEIKLIVPGGAMPPKPPRQDESSFISDD